MKHEPCCFLGDSQSAANLIRTDSILAIGNHPNSTKPFVQTDRRIFKDCSYFNRKLSLWVNALALPLVLILKKYNISAATARTGNNPIRPSLCLQILKAHVLIRKINNRLLESFQFVFVSHIRKGNNFHFLVVPPQAA